MPAAEFKHTAASRQATRRSKRMFAFITPHEKGTERTGKKRKTANSTTNPMGATRSGGKEVRNRSVTSLLRIIPGGARRKPTIKERGERNREEEMVQGGTNREPKITTGKSVKKGQLTA